MKKCAFFCRYIGTFPFTRPIMQSTETHTAKSGGGGRLSRGSTTYLAPWQSFGWVKGLSQGPYRYVTILLRMGFEPPNKQIKQTEA